MGLALRSKSKRKCEPKPNPSPSPSPSPGPNPDQVNSSPSITADTPTDYELKFGLLDDVYTIIDVEGKLGGAVEPVVGGFDLVYNNGPVKPSP